VHGDGTFKASTGPNPGADRAAFWATECVESALWLAKLGFFTQFRWRAAVIMIRMLRHSAWLHCLLTAYLWLVSWIPLGNWNRQRDGQLLPALLHGYRIGADDAFMLAFITLPAGLFWLAYKRSSFWFGVGALAFDCAWLWMQLQSWWIPYLLGAHLRWQLDYAKGPTTKILPSFGNHVAPDGMHLVIHILLAAALTTGVLALVQLKRKR
jgi:hypothetical protein